MSALHPTVLAQAFSRAARENIAETSADVFADLVSLERGTRTPESLLVHCLDGADADREQGWRDYVDGVVAIRDGWLVWDGDGEECIAVCSTREAAWGVAVRQGGGQIQRGIDGAVDAVGGEAVAS